MTVLPRLAVIAAAIPILAGCVVTSVDEAASAASRRVIESPALVFNWPPAAGADTTPVPSPETAPVDHFKMKHET